MTEDPKKVVEKIIKEAIESANLNLSVLEHRRRHNDAYKLQQALCKAIDNTLMEFGYMEYYVNVNVYPEEMGRNFEMFEAVLRGRKRPDPKTIN